MKLPPIRRKKFFVHRSIQLKYIGLSVIPGLILSIFCTHLLVKTGELLLRRENEVISVEVVSIAEVVDNLAAGEYSEFVSENVLRLQKELLMFQEHLNGIYLSALNEWSDTHVAILTGAFLVLIVVGLLALLYSHRIAGPMVRLRRCIDALAEGEEISLVSIRTYDEFKEIAESLERLRAYLRENK